MKASQPVSIVQPLFQKNGLVAEKQHLFSEKSPVPKEMVQRILSHFQLTQSDLKIRPKCQMSTHTQDKVGKKKNFRQTLNKAWRASKAKRV